MNFFKRFYVRFVQWFATFLLNRTNTVLRHLIILKGKDPDFVPPPPAPPPAPSPPTWSVSDRESNRIQPKTLKSPPSSYGNGGAQFVLDSRKKFEAKPPAPVPAPAQVTSITEIGGGAIDALREAASNIEQSIQKSENKDEK